MRILKLTLATPLLALAACADEPEEVLEVQHFEHQSGAALSVSYVSTADRALWEYNAKNLITAVTIDELDDIGFSRTNDHRGMPTERLGCDVVVKFDEFLEIDTSAKCARGNKTYDFNAPVFQAIELLVSDQDPSVAAE